MPKPAKPRAISRFIVMAMLQAARARSLGLPEPSAYSWGLNRAIFYAAAKRGFGGTSGGKSGSGEGEAAPGEVPRNAYFLGDDMAFRDESKETVYFTIGGTTQTEVEFDKQIAARFGSAANFRTAWSEATAIVEEAGPELLKSQRGFYARVYKPRRDELAAAWTEKFVRA